MVGDGLKYYKEKETNEVGDTTKVKNFFKTNMLLREFFLYGKGFPIIQIEYLFF